MIVDSFDYIACYKGLHPNLDKAIDWLNSHTLDALENGKTIIDGDKVFVNVMDADLRDALKVAQALDVVSAKSQGLDEPVGEEADDNERQNERGGCGDEEHLQCGELILREGGSVHGGKNGTDGHSGAVFASCLGR